MTCRHLGGSRILSLEVYSDCSVVCSPSMHQTAEELMSHSIAEPLSFEPLFDFECREADLDTEGDINDALQIGDLDGVDLVRPPDVHVASASTSPSSSASPLLSVASASALSLDLPSSGQASALSVPMPASPRTRTLEFDIAKDELPSAIEMVYDCDWASASTQCRLPLTRRKKAKPCTVRAIEPPPGFVHLSERSGGTIRSIWRTSRTASVAPTRRPSVAPWWSMASFRLKSTAAKWRWMIAALVWRHRVTSSGQDLEDRRQEHFLPVIHA